MSRGARIPNLGGARAFVLHRRHATAQAIGRQLAAIGLEVSDCWPELPADVLAGDFVFFDVDMGFDEQFPWKPGEAPMPLIALIGSEAPGRIEWLLSHKADAQLVKPIGNSGIYSALLIARQAFEARKGLAAEVAALEARIGERQTIVRAVLALRGKGADEKDAYRQLRSLAMGWQVSMEEAAQRVMAQRSGGQDDERPKRA